MFLVSLGPAARTGLHTIDAHMESRGRWGLQGICGVSVKQGMKAMGTRNVRAIVTGKPRGRVCRKRVILPPSP